MPIKVSKLKLDSHRVLPPDTCDYYGPPEGFLFWRAFIDDELLSDTVQPFTATDLLVEVYGNTQQHIWMDGHGKVSVRQAGPYVLWSRPIGLSVYSAPDDITDYMLSWSAIPHDRIYVFDLEDYVSAVNVLSTETDTINSQSATQLDPRHFWHPTFNRERQDHYLKRYHDVVGITPPKTTPPLLRTDELREFFEVLLIPAAQSHGSSVVDRRPFSKNDCGGYKLSRGLITALQRYTMLQVVEPPAQSVQFMIIYAAATNGPCGFRVGYTPQAKIAILFTSNPSFPLWLSGDDFDELFQDEEPLIDLR